MKKELGLQDYFNLIFRRKKAILYSTIGVVAATGLFLFFKPPVYESTSSFVLESQEISFGEKAMGFKDQSRPMGYYEAIIKSRNFQERLLDSLIQAKRQFKRDYRVNELAKIIFNEIKLTSTNYSDLIQLTVHAPEPHMAFFLALNATSILKERCQEIDQEEVSNTVRFIDNQKLTAQKNLEESERALEEFKKRTNAVITKDDKEKWSMLNDLAGMEKELASIQTEKEMAIANQNAYRQRLSQIQGREIPVDGNADSPEVRQARDRMTQIEKQLNDLIQQKGENNAQVDQLKTQLETEKRNMVNLLIQSSSQNMKLSGDGDVMMWKGLQEKMVQEEMNIFMLKNRERNYNRLIEDYKRKNPQMTENAIELMRLTRSQSVAENLYTFLLEKGEEAKIKAASGTGGMRIVDYPRLPDEPMPIQIVRNLVLALFLGLGLGFGLALLREFLDNSIQTKDDVNRIANLSVLGTVPNLSGFESINILDKLKPNGKGRNSGKNNLPSNGAYLITHFKSNSPAVESYRTLRSNLNFASLDHKIRSLVVSSANPGEGKTLTSANLAVAFSLLGEKVLLVDADLRKPYIHKLFKIDQMPGLTDYLLGDKNGKIKIYPSGVDNLKIIPCGEIPPNPAEILSSQKMTDFMHSIQEHFDVVIYDSAPILPVTDTIILAPKANGLLLVVKHASTDKRDLEHIIETLENTNTKVIGVVMNQMIASRGYGYYYSYYNKSYYSNS